MSSSKLSHITDQTTTIVPRGKPKSGRVWKIVQTKRSSANADVPQLRKSFKQAQQKRAQLKALKEISNELKEIEVADRAEERRRLEQKRKAKEQNRAKAEVVQVISDTRKIKKMNKKQLKALRKSAI